jgi:hypothetical protein
VTRKIAKRVKTDSRETRKMIMKKRKKNENKIK